METIDEEYQHQHQQQPQQEGNQQQAYPMILQPTTIILVPTAVPTAGLTVPSPPMPPPPFVLPPASGGGGGGAAAAAGGQSYVNPQAEEAEDPQHLQEEEQELPKEEQLVEETESSDITDHFLASQLYFNNAYKYLYDSKIQLTFFCNTPGYYRNGCWYNCKYNCIPGLLAAPADPTATTAAAAPPPPPPPPPPTTVLLTLSPPPQIPTALIELINEPPQPSMESQSQVETQDGMLEIKITGTPRQIIRRTTGELVIETGFSQKNSTIVLRIATNRNVGKTLEDQQEESLSLVIQTTMPHSVNSSDDIENQQQQVPNETTNTTTTTPVESNQQKVETCDQQIQVFAQSPMANEMEQTPIYIESEQQSPPLASIQMESPEPCPDNVLFSINNTEQPMLEAEFKLLEEDDQFEPLPMTLPMLGPIPMPLPLPRVAENEASVANITYWPPLGSRLPSKCKTRRNQGKKLTQLAGSMPMNSKQKIKMQRNRKNGESNGAKPKIRNKQKVNEKVTTIPTPTPTPTPAPTPTATSTPSTNHKMEEPKKKKPNSQIIATSSRIQSKGRAKIPTQIKIKLNKGDVPRNRNMPEAYTSNMFDILATIETNSSDSDNVEKEEEEEEKEVQEEIDDVDTQSSMTIKSRRKDSKKKKKQKQKQKGKSKAKPKIESKTPTQTNEMKPTEMEIKTEWYPWRDPIPTVTVTAIVTATATPIRVADSSSSEGQVSYMYSESSEDGSLSDKSNA